MWTNVCAISMRKIWEFSGATFFICVSMDQTFSQIDFYIFGKLIANDKYKCYMKKRKHGVTDHLKKILVDEITWGKILKIVSFHLMTWQNSVLQQQKD